MEITSIIKSVEIITGISGKTGKSYECLQITLSNGETKRFFDSEFVKYLKLLATVNK